MRPPHFTAIVPKNTSPQLRFRPTENYCEVELNVFCRPLRAAHLPRPMEMRRLAASLPGCDAAHLPRPMEMRRLAASLPDCNAAHLPRSMETRLRAASLNIQRNGIEDSIQRSPRHLLQYTTGHATTNGILKLRRLTNSLRYRCGPCFAHLNRTRPTREGRACRGHH